MATSCCQHNDLLWKYRKTKGILSLKEILEETLESYSYFIQRFLASKCYFERPNDGRTGELSIKDWTLLQWLQFRFCGITNEIPVAFWLCSNCKRKRWQLTHFEQVLGKRV